VNGENRVLAIHDISNKETQDSRVAQH
jgi:hypothetical protein